MATASITSQTLALAGVLQSAYLVDQIARTGKAPAESINPSLHSLFAFDASNTAAVYGGIHGVKLGLQVLSDIINGSSRHENRTIIRYMMGMLYLQKKLSANDELLNIMRSRLEHASLKAEHFSDNPASTAKSIAAIYQDTLSTFKFRIQVSGSMQQLQDTRNADTIRALLLAGIRSAVLWRQTGGRRWKWVFNRSQLLDCAKELLSHVNQH